MEESYPLMCVNVWKNIHVSGDNLPIRIEANWYNDYAKDAGEQAKLEDVIDIKIWQSPDVTDRGLFLSLQGWKELATEVNVLLEYTKEEIRHLIHHD